MYATRDLCGPEPSRVARKRACQRAGASSRSPFRKRSNTVVLAARYGKVARRARVYGAPEVSGGS